MKDFVYRAYALVFRMFSRLCSVDSDKVFLFMVYDCHFEGNLRFVYEETRRKYPEKKCVIYSKAEMLHPTGGNALIRPLRKLGGLLRFLFGVNYQMATSGTVFLNDNFLPMAYMEFGPDTRVVQVWHGAGAFKRFGLSTESDPLVRKLVSTGNAKVFLEPVSSKKCIGIYSEAMGIPKERILPIGLPFLDFYFDRRKKEKAGEAFYKAYPKLRGKHIAFYCPTLRNTQEKNDSLSAALDRESLLSELGEDWVFLLRYHPKGIPANAGITSDHVIDVTGYPDIKGIFVASDLMITDYSSAAVEYALLRKPVYVYGFDYAASEEREGYDRGTYMDLTKLPTGVSETMEELLSVVTDREKGCLNAIEYVRQNYGPLPDGTSTAKLLSIVYKR